MYRDPVKQSLIVVKPLLGGERGWVTWGGALTALVTWMVFYGYGFTVAGLVGGSMFALVLKVARAIYKADPYMSDVLEEYQSYSDFYCGASSYHHVEPSVKDFI